MNKFLRYILLGIIAIVLYLLFFKEKETEPPFRTYNDIVQSGILRAVTEYNSISYHVQGDTLVGFHYELLQHFAKSQNLNLEIIPEMDFNKQIEGVLNGNYDILANGIQTNTELKDTLLFSEPIILNKQVLVQRKPLHDNDSNYIHSPLELAGKTIHTVKGSPSIMRIHHLSNEIGDTIYIQEIEKYGSEQLLAMVANKDIDYTICEENIAINAKEAYPELDIQTVISFTQFYSWGINKRNKELLDSLNLWITQYKETDSFKKLKKKYLP